MLKHECVVCKNIATYEPGLGLVQEKSWTKISCPRCGIYNSHCGIVLNLNKKQQANASSWLRENSNSIELLTQNIANSFAKLKSPSIEKRIFLLLNWILKETDSSLGGWVNFPFSDVISEEKTQELLGHCYCLDKNELKFLVDFLIDKRLIEDARRKYQLTTNAYCLTVEGFNYIDKLNKDFGSNTGFCAMWFSDPSCKSEEAWLNGINLAIEGAGYESVLIKDRDHIAGIMDEVFAQIRCCRFVIADLTGHRPNVYYEAGFAQGLNIPVIFTCQKDDLDKKHFDISHLNILEWDANDFGNFKKRLEKRIESNFGRGKNKINIVNREEALI